MLRDQQSNFQTFCMFSQRVQNIKHKIQTTEVDLKMRAALHHELEVIHDQLIEQLSLSTPGTCHLHEEFEKMNPQIISLYREIEERFEEHEVKLISKEALTLSRSLSSGKVAHIAAKIEGLRYAIGFLLKCRCPSARNRKIVHLAKELSDRVEAATQIGAKVPAYIASIEKVDRALQELIEWENYLPNLEEEELAMELYEIAELFEERRYGEGKMRLELIRYKLTKAQRQKLDAAAEFPHKTADILHSIASRGGCIEWDQYKEPESVIASLHA